MRLRGDIGGGCVCVVETLHAGEDFFSQNSIPNPGI